MSCLIIGNSHVAAYRTAIDLFDSSFAKEFKFCAAKGDNMQYATFKDGSIYSKDSFVDQHGANINLKRDFSATYGEEKIDVKQFKTIFYVSGVNPFDCARVFARTLGLPIILSSPLGPVEAECVATYFRENNALYKVMGGINNYYGQIVSQHFIGNPFMTRDYDVDVNDSALFVRSCRKSLERVINKFPWSSVFMPPERLLTPSLLSTHPDFAREGRRDTAIFFNDTKSSRVDDVAHVNSKYAYEVYKEFIADRM